LRGDIVLAILGLIAAYIASQYDCKLINISRFSFSTNELVIGIYFVIIIAIVLAIIYSYYLIKSSIWGKRVQLELVFNSNPGRIGFGRYFVMYINNRSLGNLINCDVRLINIQASDGKWAPDLNMIIREDAFLWGSGMIIFSANERAGKKSIEKNNHRDTLVDLLHTGDNNSNNRFYLTQQYLGEGINGPPGIYDMDIAIRGLHLGQFFSIPVRIRFVFDGEMKLSGIHVEVNEENRIKTAVLVFDGNTTMIKD